MNQEIKDMLQKLTLEEKVSLCSGADFWHTEAIEKLGLPRVMMCDGPHGLRKQEGEGDHLGINDSIKTVCYPSASALASSFDTDVLAELGKALGEECQAEDVGMLLGPGLNMKRSPLCGRNFEYFSEDPYLAGKLGAAYIKSLQESGTAACVKHFAANNQEKHRMSGSSNLDERTLYEIYFPAFEMAVKEGKTRSVMCAYNKINDTFCSENKQLLTDTLRTEWGFEGFVVTDWGAGKDAAKGVKAGLNLVMPGGYKAHEAALMEALKNGQLTEEELDLAAADILKFINDYVKHRQPGAEINREECARLSEKIAVQCAVLLKNDDILPLKKSAKVAFIGAFAEKPRYQGSGSSHINTDKITGALEAAKEFAITFAKGYEPKAEDVDEMLQKEAVEAAEKADIAVVFAGLPDSFETEGVDRDNLELPVNQNELIMAISKIQKNVVVVLHGGSAMSLPWLDQVKAVLCVHLGGQEVGSATVKLLYGDENPSGKLSESWPLKLSDNPSYLNFPGVDGVVDYHEGIYIGYRYYDKKEMAVLFPFGYGLSYTSFSYSDIKLDKEHMNDQETLTVTCKVENSGLFAGKEIVQLYVRDLESSVGRPVRELKGFVKVALEPGEQKEVRFVLDKRSFAYFEPKIHDWYVESGEFAVEIGASSRDIRLTAPVQVEGSVELPFHYTIYSPFSALLKTKCGRQVFESTMQVISAKQQSQGGMEALGEGAEKMKQQMMLDMPLGAMAGFGAMTKEQLQETLQLLNGNKHME